MALCLRLPMFSMHLTQGFLTSKALTASSSTSLRQANLVQLLQLGQVLEGVLLRIITAFLPVPSPRKLDKPGQETQTMDHGDPKSGLLKDSRQSCSARLTIRTQNQCNACQTHWYLTKKDIQTTRGQDCRPQASLLSLWMDVPDVGSHGLRRLHSLLSEASCSLDP